MSYWSDYYRGSMPEWEYRELAKMENAKEAYNEAHMYDEEEEEDA